MGIEIEAKLKVDALAPVEARLRTLRAEFVAEQHQRDVYYDDPLRALTGTDRWFRVRHQQAAERQEVVLTYKGPLQQDTFKKRVEIEVPIGDGEALGQVLDALGYRQVIVVDKTRRVWKQGGCLVGLDDVVELGTFVEIEGPDDQAIAAVQKALGLDRLSHIPKSYAHMLAARREARQ
jgi:adenylate cyclase class 2